MTKQQLRFKYLPSIVISIVFIVLACVFRFVILDKPAVVSIETSSNLMDVINIAELSTAEFRYRGIAEVYKNEEKTKLLCRICYNSIVKAGIDMENVKLDVDTDNKQVTAVLPDIDIKVTIIDEDSMAILPSDAKVGIEDMLKCCKEDAETEAKNSKELFATAQDNLKETLQGLMFPILKAEGYSLVWK